MFFRFRGGTRRLLGGQESSSSSSSFSLPSQHDERRRRCPQLLCALQQHPVPCFYPPTCERASKGGNRPHRTGAFNVRGMDRGAPQPPARFSCDDKSRNTKLPNFNSAQRGHFSRRRRRRMGRTRQFVGLNVDWIHQRRAQGQFRPRYRDGRYFDWRLPGCHSRGRSEAAERVGSACDQQCPNPFAQELLDEVNYWEPGVVNGDVDLLYLSVIFSLSSCCGTSRHRNPISEPPVFRKSLLLLALPPLSPSPSAPSSQLPSSDDLCKRTKVVRLQSRLLNSFGRALNCRGGWEAQPDSHDTNFENYEPGPQPHPLIQQSHGGTGI